MRLTATLNHDFHIDDSIACSAIITDAEGNHRGIVQIEFEVQHRILTDFSLSDLPHYAQALCILQVSEMLDSHFDNSNPDQEPYTEISFDA